MQFAVDYDCATQLLDELLYLGTYADGNVNAGTTCELYPDFAPNSFAFLMRHKDGKPWFNGGLIYSGPGQPLNGSFPALTVGIGIDSSKHGWSVHT